MLTRNKWTKGEDDMLREYVMRYIPGKINWKQVANGMPGRNKAQCRERWRQYVNPNINNSPFTLEEDMLLESLVRCCGTKWAHFRNYFKDRTDTALKNQYRRLQKVKNETKKYRSIVGRYNKLVHKMGEENETKEEEIKQAEEKIEVVENKKEKEEEKIIIEPDQNEDENEIIHED